MTDVKTEKSNITRTAALVIAGVVLIGGTVFGAIQLSGGGESTVPPSGDVKQTEQGDDVQKAGVTLPEAMSGQEAIDALGDDITTAAKLNNMSVDELEALLLKDPTAYVSKNGIIGYKDPGVK